MRRFLPDFRMETYREIDETFLRNHNVRALILDIDNTLEPYENSEPGEGVLSWFAMLRAAGVGAAFVSNNERERVETFNRTLQLPAYWKAGKPMAKIVRQALAVLDVPPENALLVGDQIFTDVWAAHNAGIRAVLVPPIRDKRDLLTKVKRLLERPLLHRYDKEHKNDGK